MYRWLNIRSVCGGTGGEPSRLYEPDNLPDSECDGRHFVFVHGYNVNSADARKWGDQMFKRLRLSGSKSMFTAVNWKGDESQFSLMFSDKQISPDYKLLTDLQVSHLSSAEYNDNLYLITVCKEPLGMV